MSLQDRIRTILTKHHYIYWGRDHIQKWSVKHITSFQNRDQVKVLDVGCAWGSDLLNIKSELPKLDIHLMGIEVDPKLMEMCRKNGIDVHDIDIEHNRFPFADASIDITIINQVIEHTKEIFWVFSEISRVLSPGGIVIVGVPNLAALHERILMLLGKQPRCIKAFGPHVRGFTADDFTVFVQKGGYFNVKSYKGSNIFPLPPRVGRVFNHLFPKLSYSLFFMIERTTKPGTFIEVLNDTDFNTEYVCTPPAPHSNQTLVPI